MKTSIVRIGNSKGVRLPRAVLKQCGFQDTVELEVQQNRLVIRPARSARQGWDEAFADMAKAGDDTLLDRDSIPVSHWDRTEWRW